MIKWGRQCRWNEQCPVHRKPSINVAIIREHQSLTIWNDLDREGFYGQSLRNIWFNKNKEGYLLKDLPTQCSVFLQDLPNWFGHSTHFQEASRYTSEHILDYIFKKCGFTRSYITLSQKPSQCYLLYKYFSMAHSPK